jgi:hypothetical protein
MTLTSELSMNREFRVGNTLNRAAQLFFSAHLPKFCAISGITFAPLLITAIGAGQPIDQFGNQRVADFAIWTGVGGLLRLVLGPIGTAVSLYGAYQAMRGAPFTIADSFRAAWWRFGAVLGAALLGSLITIVLAMLLIVPGIMAVCALYVALPACVLERLGPLNSLRRSRDLTRGARWRILGMILVVGLISGVMSGIAGGAVGATRHPVAVGIVSYVASAIASAFHAVLTAVTYRDLRVAKEGIDIEGLAKVFE